MHGLSWNSKETLHIRITLEEKNGMIEAEIADDGVGIPPEQLQKINARLQSHSDEGHIGLYSCNKRLCLTFSEDCGLHLSLIHI